MDVIHTAIHVSDLEATKSFYEGTLGLEHSWEFTTDDGVLNYYAGTEDGADLQFKYREGDASAVDPSGIDHIAFAVEDAEAEFERVVSETDCPVVVEPKTMDDIGRRVAFVEDPDGYVVEFVERIE